MEPIYIFIAKRNIYTSQVSVEQVVNVSTCLDCHHANWRQDLDASVVGRGRSWWFPSKKNNPRQDPKQDMIQQWDGFATWVIREWMKWLWSPYHFVMPKCLWWLFSASSSTHKAFLSWLFSSPKFFTILKCLAGRGNFRHETKRSCQPRIVLTKLIASMIEVSMLS